MSKPATARMSPDTWDSLEWDGKRPAHIAVRLASNLWAVSPDGYGAYYFDSLEELTDNYCDLEYKD